MGDRGLVLHVPQSWLEDDTQMLPFYRKLGQGLDRLDVPWAFEGIDRAIAITRIESDRKFHIFNHGRVEHSRALNAGVAYIYPFWNLDPRGVRAFSSIGDQKFRPFKIDSPKVKPFFGKLRDRWVTARDSRYDQPRSPEELPEGAVAVFFQSEADRDLGETCYLDRWTMLETTLEARDGPVVVKPHPLEMDQDIFNRLLDVQKRYPQLVISQGNIHDILAACVRVVTINSAVGIEAFLHRKPVILCGKADFHHLTIVAQDREALTQALRNEVSGRVYAKYLYWYFGKNCVDAGRDDVAEQVLRRVIGTGYEMS
ncbi:hypothetical protein [Shimia sp.]|uniref:capsular polysaccharide export protein, LipB/KpsS family n=1 Tax=Shimia sp. TaxID=1954381 RepID=UPI00329951C6